MFSKQNGVDSNVDNFCLRHAVAAVHAWRSGHRLRIITSMALASGVGYHHHVDAF
jgi:hypothetical protein